MDPVRGLLSALVVVHHAAVTYGPVGSWYYVERQPISLTLNLAFATFVIFNQFFFMGFFFLLAGCFIPASLERKGSRLFLRDRLLRLGLPLLLFAFFVNPWTSDLAIAAEIAPKTAGLWMPPLLFPLFQHIAPGPLWFVETLLVFSLVVVAARLWRRGPSPASLAAPSLPQIVAFSVALASTSFAVRFFYPASKELWHLQLGFFPQYILLFWVGLRSRQARFLEEIPARWFWPAVAVSGICAIALAALLTPLFLSGGAEEMARTYRGGPHWQAAGLCLLEAVECPAMIVTLVLLFRDRVPNLPRFWNDLGPDSYTVYIIHAPVLVLVSVVLRGWNPSVPVKFALVSLVTLVLCFVLSRWGLRKIPGVKLVLG
jgi:peptidoglycan/LPS O-acetylase OafA/YrhL